MSRETDTPSSGPNGRGGTAYPSGTPPYGTPTASDNGADAGRSGGPSEERKTETTLTTRIRINIPGSRPIPPVVVRKPVADTEGADGGGAETAPPGAATSTGTVESPAEQQQPGTGEEKTSDWFAPRKSGTPKPGQGGGATNGTGPSGGSAAPGAPATAPGGARPGGVVGSMNLPGTSRPGAPNGARPGGTNGAGLPGATGGPVAPGHGGGTGSFDVTEALAAGPLGNGNGNGSRPGEPRRDDLPYFTEPGQNGPNGQGTPNGQDPYGTRTPYGGQGAAPNGQNGPGGYGGLGGPGGPVGPQGPAGPTRGPVTGDSPLATPNAAGAPGTAPHPGPGGGLSDDTAILTPQKPAPEPPPGSPFAPVDNVSGDTLSSGIPVVPPADRSTPFAPGAPTGGPLPHTPPKRPEPAQQSAPAAAPKKKKKGRNKLVLLGGGVFAIAGVAYGAGLLMNHSDVPKGTTVLGVDIGGGTRDDAVKKLDEALGDRFDIPVKLSVDGETVSLKPDQSGLQFDADATVGAAAKSDYNPVSVIGSLFGQERVVEPVMPVDEEKLQSALQTAAGGAGSATDGTIRFESGKAVAVYGKAGKGIDVDRATEAVEEAYRTQVETGTATPVQVPTTTKQPTVSNAEVDRMMKEFAEPAMSANVTVRTDAAHTIAFSPENSLWKFLRVKAIDGKLVDTYDEAALQELYGKTFDGVLITRATGQKTPVTVQDVIGALRPALKSTTNRVATIDTSPN
ncbi:hypothetical protein K4749_10330 [Streptomyces sp. TRM72054]|uniref:hypothetical protein n=1 Tax=Streptomyces sp. TRM72054 TaxID=2870562 RepID=UPI001C8B4DBE|nr:hypothetical protein [Streptomyces sp. TRM72054]MBX9393976.1 hypothetical protein [Streptomyces sp. TRM72054]